MAVGTLERVRPKKKKRDIGVSQPKKRHLDSMEEGVSMEVQDLLTTKVEEMMIGIVRCEMDMEEL